MIKPTERCYPMEAYLDNCVVSGMVRDDLPTAEMAVIPVLEDRSLTQADCG